MASNSLASARTVPYRAARARRSLLVMERCVRGGKKGAGGAPRACGARRLARAVGRGRVVVVGPLGSGGRVSVPLVLRNRACGWDATEPSWRPSC